MAERRTFAGALTVALALAAGLALPISPLRAAGPDEPLPRIAVVDGRFVERDTGRAFTPSGFNYIRLRDIGYLWHDTFNPRTYDAARVDEALETIAAHGFNIVRVFIDDQGGPIGVAERDATELSPAYMGNVIDFLQRARRHRVYVIASVLGLPDSRRYREIAGPRPDDVGPQNAIYVHPGHIAAKAQYMADFAAAIRRHDAGLLSTVFAYELENETNLLANQPPFSLRAGTFAFQGATYDLTTDADLQRLADDGVRAHAEASVAAVREVDPDAMVSINVFTFAAVRRGGPGRLLQDETRDRRFPARPLALADTSLSYLDIHLYNPSSGGLNRDLLSVEWPALREACRAGGKPILMGEFGAFRHHGATSAEAAATMRGHLQRVLNDHGFAGFLYWTYDNEEQFPGIWHARSGDGEIFRMLAEFVPQAAASR